MNGAWHNGGNVRLVRVADGLYEVHDRSLTGGDVTSDGAYVGWVQRYDWGWTGGTDRLFRGGTGDIGGAPTRRHAVRLLLLRTRGISR